MAKCQEIADKADCIDVEMMFLMASAHLYFYVNDFEQALFSQKRYLRLAEEGNFLFPIFRGSANMAVTYQTQGEYDLAERHYHRALQIAQKRGDISSEVFVQVNLTDFYNITGEIDLAIELGKEALKNSEQIGRFNFYRLALLGLAVCRSEPEREI